MSQDSPSIRPLTLMAVSLNPHSPEFLAVAKGIQAVCRDRGWTLHQCFIDGLAESARDWRPDAFIVVLAGAGGMRPTLVRGRVVISAGEDLCSRGWPSVVLDDQEIGRQAARRHLLDRGFRSLAAFGLWHDTRGNLINTWAARRMEGFAEAARSEGVSIRRLGDNWIDPVSGMKGHTRFSPPHMLRWLADLPKPVGIMAGCDYWGSNLLALCREWRFRVPEDIAIVSAGDEQATCELADPPLSSVAVPWDRLGRTSAELAGNAIAGCRLPKRAVVVPPAGVTARRSSDLLAIEDPDVAAALAIIISHADQPLKVGQILRQVPATQSRLERHFKKVVGRRMIDEIRRVHIEHAKRLLAETDLAIPAIASQSGFGSATRLGIAFRKETGVAPSKFRRRFRTSV